MHRLRDPVVLVLAGLSLMLGAGTCGVAEITPDRTEQMAISSLGLQLGFCALALAGAAFARRSTARRLGWVPGRLSPLRVTLLALGTLALSHGLDGILQITGLRDESAIANLDAELAGARGRILLASLLGVGLAPGFGEELFCRGLVQRGLVDWLGPAAGIVLASLFFGLLHADPIHGSAAAVLGLYLGTVAWLAGSIRASVVCHVANNLAAVLLAAYASSVGPGSVVAVFLGLFGAAAALAWVWWRAGSPPRRWPPAPSDAGLPPVAP